MTTSSPDLTRSFPPDGPLAGLKAVSLAGNIPGPVAASALLRDGLSVTKVEGPGGDMLAQAAPGLYAELAAGQTVLTLDLRAESGQQAFREQLSGSDLLITSQRPAALARLGVTREALADLNPQLCWVEIVGDTTEPEVPGHDLTYQLQAGLLAPPQMPRSLLADLSGAHEAARAAVTLLLGRERGRPERWRRVGLRQAAEGLALPLRHGLTAEGGWLSGRLPGYRLYALKDGWVGVAALEPHFAGRLEALLDGRRLPEVLGDMTADECNRLAQQHDLPLHAIASEGAAQAAGLR
ncbi:CoA transferase [Deinococcus sp. Marseille-Q6407]|uniref:CoA transferase n=1 Tax=Deinococcus sp. Marseille-Q6407 TaxID=2969223 RepID=UPI0021C08AB6|nr:CoA transferase [Deinococcus sp. Marseille-Q6407]